MKLFLVLIMAFLSVLTGCHTRQPEKVTRDLAKLHARAERGDAEAQYELGRAYAEIWNPVEAVRWYRKAAEQGIAEAQYWLGQSYATSQGVTRDAAEAYAWFCLATAQDNRQAMNARDKIVRQMTRAEIDEGNRRAYEYITRHPAAKGKASPAATERVLSPAVTDTNAVSGAPPTSLKSSTPQNQSSLTRRKTRAGAQKFHKLSPPKYQ
jgi:hypothetical protein